MANDEYSPLIIKPRPSLKSIGIFFVSVRRCVDISFQVPDAEFIVKRFSRHI